MAEDTKDSFPEQQPRINSFGENFRGFLCFNFLLVIITFNVCLLTALFYYPFHVSVYVLLPYYTYHKVLTRPEIKQGGRWVNFSKNFFLFRIERKFLQMSFHTPLPKKFVDAENSNNAQFVIAVFPHGTAADYRIGMDGMLDTVFPNIYNKIRTLGASVLFLIPIVREFVLWTSGIDASRTVAEKALDKGYTLLVMPGGESEQIQTIYQRERVYLKNRKGFLKLALRKGVPVVPIYVFGCSDYYQTSIALLQPRLWLVKNLGICIPFAVGMWGSILCPYPVKTTMVIGEPLVFKVKDATKPSPEELDEAHESFCMALMNLFNEHKGPLGYGDRNLEIL
jgi:2-acylglycerol O-acyltransferase 2